MRAEEITFKEAINNVKNKRPIVCPNEGFQNELKKFEATVVKKIFPAIDKQSK